MTRQGKCGARWRGVSVALLAVAALLVAGLSVAALAAALGG